ncbi:hypothetical protein X734_09635 [Mesorhizobium sp. L2C084A000]|nr:hypothetical protein X734_09635 [Mesorhizobium sp. L2C084A000]
MMVDWKAAETFEVVVSTGEIIRKILTMETSSLYFHLCTTVDNARK